MARRLKPPPRNSLDLDPRTTSGILAIAHALSPAELKRLRSPIREGCKLKAVSGAVFTLRFRDEETLRSLERTAAALGVSTADLAEAAIERELTVVGSDLDHRLTRALEQLKSAGRTNLDQEIEDFAHGELTFGDPLRAHRVEASERAEVKEVDTSDTLGRKVDETITFALQRLGVPTREEIRNLTKHVEELSAKVELLRPRVTPASRATGRMAAANKSSGKNSS